MNGIVAVQSDDRNFEIGTIVAVNDIFDVVYIYGYFTRRYGKSAVFYGNRIILGRRYACGNRIIIDRVALSVIG